MQAGPACPDVIGSFAGFRLLVEEHHVVARPDGEPVVIGPVGPLRRLPGRAKSKAIPGTLSVEEP